MSAPSLKRNYGVTARTTAWQRLLSVTLFTAYSIREYGDKHSYDNMSIDLRTLCITLA